MVMPLTTLPNLQSIFNIPAGDSSQNALLNLYITEATEQVLHYCHRKDFGIVAYQETKSGNNLPTLTLNNLPVINITALYVDDNALGGDAPGAFASTTQLTQGVDYWLDRDYPGGPSSSGILRNTKGYWFRPYNWIWGLIEAQQGPPTGNILVQYTAGYQTVPASVQSACEQVIAGMRTSRQWGTLINTLANADMNVQMQQQSKLDLGLFTPLVRNLLAHYVKIIVDGGQ